MATEESSFGRLLSDSGIGQAMIQDILSSGYYLRDFGDPFSGKTSRAVSDSFYGNKQFSSCFSIEQFLDYVRGGVNSFSSYSEFETIVVKSRAEIDAVLATPRRQHYLQEGSMSFRGQSREYLLKRSFPNPVQSNDAGQELSIMPGAFRQSSSIYSCDVPAIEQRLAKYLPRDLLDQRESADIAFAYDPMRVEQHYATQTCGLDISFDLEVALFFATHRFKWLSDRIASYEKIANGGHTGVIYAFRFTNSPVKREAFLIQEFDLFRKNVPERVLRQNCGLPLIGDYERNIAITDIDCVLRIHPDYEDNGALTPQHLFPPVSEDRFYGRLLESKDAHPERFESVVEYEWAR